MNEKTQGESENEKIRDMLDNYDSLSPKDKNFLGLLILSRFSREENMSRFFGLHVTGEEHEVNNIFNPDDLILAHVTEEDFDYFLHTLLERNFKDDHFYVHLFDFTFGKYQVDLGYDEKKGQVYVFKYPDVAVKIWRDSVRSGKKITRKAIAQIEDLFRKDFDNTKIDEWVSK